MISLKFFHLHVTNFSYFINDSEQAGTVNLGRPLTQLHMRVLLQIVVERVFFSTLIKNHRRPILHQFLGILRSNASHTATVLLSSCHSN